MSDLTYFDCNVLVGQRPMKHRRERWSTEHLLEDMDLAEIAGALTVHAVATTYDPVYGNARLHAEVAKAPGRLFPAWCIAPLGGPGAHRTEDDLLRAMDEQGVRAVRIPPTGLSAQPEFLGPTLDALQEQGVLTLMEVGGDRHPAGWGADDPFAFFHGLLSRHPRLPLLLVDHYWAQQAQIHRLMELHDNLHVEFSGYQVNRGLERYVADFGDERLLFGSGMTAKSPGAARSFVDYAQIPSGSRSGGSREVICAGSCEVWARSGWRPCEGPATRSWPTPAKGGPCPLPLSTLIATCCTREARPPDSGTSCTTATRTASLKPAGGAASTVSP